MAELPIGNLRTAGATIPNDTFEPSKIFSEVKLKSLDNSITADNHSAADYRSQNEDCTDECLCHITPTNVLAFVMPKHLRHSLATPINLKFQPSSELPPPYQPPQFS